MNTTSPAMRKLGLLNVTLSSITLLLSTLAATPADRWQSRAPCPGARAAHSSVWTGREMILWGGGSDGSFLNTGGRYLPATDAWRTTSLNNAPSPRWFHAAVWTGREMIIWGGRANFFGYDNYNDGARYNPETDTWTPLSTLGAPLPRSQCAAVWTGKEMLVWGGATDGGIELNDGARYNPETDTWTPIANASGLEPRMEPTGIWTGEELIIFGGMKFTGGQLSFGNGARYRPITDTWTPLPTVNGPGSRTEHTAVWTGERMIVWGGRILPAYETLNDGSIYSPGSDTWTPVSSEGAPQARMLHAAVWTGSEMIVWGGQAGSSGLLFNTGARYNPAIGQWTPTTQDGAAGKRMFWRPDLGIWTGEAMIIAAGSDYPASLDSTSLYFPIGLSIPPPPPTNCVPAPSGLVAWWRAEGNADDATGSNAGQLLFGATFAPGRVGQAFSFDGISSRVSVPDAEVFKLTDSLSFEGWIRAASLAPGIIFFRGDNRPGLDPYAMALGTSGHLHWGINNERNEFAAVDAPELLPTEVWTHVAAVLNGATGELALYVNGLLVSQTNTTIRPLRDLDPQSGPAVGIGNHGGTFHNFPFHGLVDEWALYSRALSSAEILAIYHAGAAGKCPGASPPQPQQNLVFNGSFELGVAEEREIDAPDSTAITGWTVPSGSIDYYGHSWAAGDGLRSVDMNGSTAGTISQQVSGFTVGQGYRLSFLMAGNPGLIPPLPAVKRLRASLGSAAQEYSFDATGFNEANLGWTLRTLDFTADSPTLTLSFVSLTEGLGGAALDNVSIVAVINPPPVGTNCVPAPSGLVAWWAAEGNDSDRAGSNEGVLLGGVGFQPGKVGSGFFFPTDGTGAVKFAASPSLDVGAGEGLTVEGWILLANVIPIAPIAEWNNGTWWGSHFHVVNQSLYANLTGPAGEWHQVFSSEQVQTGVLQHVALTYDKAGGQAKLYLNGKAVADQAIGSFTPQTAFDFYLGRRAAGDIQASFSGLLDEFSLYRRALSSNEIIAIHLAGAAGKCAGISPALPLYDLSRDFSRDNNPAGPWSYGYESTIGDDFTLFTFAKTSPTDNGVPLDIWAKNTFEPSAIFHNATTSTALSDGGAGVYPPGTVILQAGIEGHEDNYGAVRFRVPAGAAGTYRLASSVRTYLDGPYAGDADYHVLKNRVELFGQFLPGNTGTGYTNLLALGVGDTLDFLAGRGADNIAYASGLKIQVTLTLIPSNTEPPQCVVPPSGLVAWWPAEGNANDVIGTNRGTWSGGAAYAPGEVGSAFAFHSTSNAVRIAASPGLDVGAGAGMTIELWINPDDVTQRGPLVEWNNGVDLWGAHFWILPNQAGAGLQPPSGALAGPGQLYAAFTLLGQWYQMVTDAGVLSPHVFQHVALTYDKTTGLGRIYRNGQLVAEQALGTFTPQTAYDLYLGHRPAGPPGNPPEAYHGLMDEVAIYHRALAPAEIASIYLAGSAGKCRHPAALNELRTVLNAASDSVDKPPVLATLEAVRASIGRGNLVSAINQLHALQEKVEAQIGPSDPELAGQLFAMAQELIGSLDPSGARRAQLAALTGTPASLQRVLRVAGTGRLVEGWAMPGALFSVERSPDLRDWAEAGLPVEVSDGVFQFVDPQPDESAHFYRLRSR